MTGSHIKGKSCVYRRIKQLHFEVWDNRRIIIVFLPVHLCGFWFVCCPPLYIVLVYQTAFILVFLILQMTISPSGCMQRREKRARWVNLFPQLIMKADSGPLRRRAADYTNDFIMSCFSRVMFHACLPLFLCPLFPFSVSIYCCLSFRVNARILAHMWSMEAGIKPVRWTGESRI